MVPTAIKHIYQTPHNQQTVSKGVREKQCLLPWNTSTKQSANSQQGTVDKQSAGTVSKQASKCDYPAYVIATIQLVARYNYVQLTTDYTAATNATICHYHRRHSFPPPPLCAVAADTAAEPDRAPSLRPLLAAAGTAVAAEPPYLLLLPSEERKGVRMCLWGCECVNVCVSPDNRQGL